MSFTMKELPEGLRPYEKCFQNGAQSLDDAELLAVLLKTGTCGMNAVELSQKIIGKAGGTISGLARLSREDLEQIPGVGKVKAAQIECVIAFAKRFSKSTYLARPSFDRPEWVASCYMEEMRHEEQEILKVLFLDMKCHLIREENLTKGSVSSTIVPIREIMIRALRCNAVQMILLHNHPSGDPTPSEEDRRTTENVREAGCIMGIPLVDHIVIGDQKYVSLREKGWIG